MNKLFTKIGVAFVGIAMAIGVGVAIGNSQKNAIPVGAETGTGTNVQTTLGSGSGQWNAGKNWSYTSSSTAATAVDTMASADAAGQTWTVSYQFSNSQYSKSQNDGYIQFGANNKTPVALSIYSSAFSKKMKLTAFSYKYGGSGNGAAGRGDFYVDSTSIQTGTAFSGQTDQTISWTGERIIESGSSLKVIFTGMAKGVRIYYVKYTLVDAPTGYSVTYQHGTEGTGDDYVVSDITSGSTHNLVSFATSGFSANSGYSFKAWNVGGNERAVGYGLTVTSNVVVTAVYATTRSLTYDANGGTGTAPDTQYVGDGGSVTASANTFTNSGFLFDGWNTSPDGEGAQYEVGASVTVSGGNIVLYAQWATAYGVTYLGNGNTGGSVPVDANQYKKDDSVTVLGNTGSLVKTGYDFAGWNTQNNGNGTDRLPGSNFSMGTSNVTLYAKWVEIGPVISFTAGTDVSDGTSITKNGVTLTATSFSGDTYYNAYKNTNLVVTSTIANITKITVVCTAEGTSSYGPGNITSASGTYSYSSYTGIWAGSASSVTLSTATGGIRMTSVTVQHAKLLPMSITSSVDEVTVGGDTIAITASQTGVTWSSSDPEKATVNPTTGVVTAVAPGTTTITAHKFGYDDANVVVSVLSNDPWINLSDSTITGYVGDEFSVTATYGNLVGDLSWSTSGTGSITRTENETGATYSGTLTSAGTLTLTAGDSGSETSASVVFTIISPTYVHDISFSCSSSNTAFSTSTWATAAQGDNQITCASTSYIYPEDNAMRVSSGSNGGSISLTTKDDLKIKRVILHAKSYGSDASVGITVTNGGSAQTITDSYAYYTFDLSTTSKTVTITGVKSKRYYVDNIILIVEGQAAMIGAYGYAATFLNGTAAGCAAHNGDTLGTAWTTLKSTWNSLDATYSGAAAYFGGVTADKDGNIIEEAAARYEDILSKYTLENFMSRSLSANYIVASFNDNQKTDSAVLIIVVISLMSLTAIGGYFLIRRRKENN